MRYISLFSGIECASAAWGTLGWEPVAFSEIDPFASAVLAYRFPNVPNVGDITKHDWAQYRGKVDLVVGGSPCQSYSVAGLRKSLDDPRGRLTLAYVEAVNAIRPAWIVWENVPAVQSTPDNAFGCFLAGLVGADGPLCSGGKRGRWPDAGLVIGPQRAACWAILDSQFFGVPQRRRRMFCVAVEIRHASFAPGKVPNPAAVLLEWAGLPGHPTPRGEARQEAVAPSGSRASANGGGAVTVAGVGGGGAGGRADGAAAERFVPCVEGIPDVSGTLGGGSGERGFTNSPDVWGAMIPCYAESGNGPGPVPAVTAKWAKGCGGPAGDEAQHLAVYPLLEIGKRGGPSNDRARAGAGIGADGDPMFTLQAGAKHGVAYGDAADVAGTVTARLGTAGADENDAARGMLVSFHPTQDPIESTDVTHALGCGSSKGQASVAVVDGAVPLDLRNATRKTPMGSHLPGSGCDGQEGDPAFTVSANGSVQAVAFTSKDYGADAGEIAPTLRAMGHAASHMNGGGQVAVAVGYRGQTEISPPLRSSPGGTLRPEAAGQIAIVQTVAGDVAHTLRAEGADASEDGTGRGTPVVALAMRGRDGGAAVEEGGETAFALRASQGGGDKPYVATPLVVRRLTPRECERLQGLPDDWTLIPYGKGKRCKDLAEFAAYLGVAPEVAKTLSADSLRYKGCGNGMAVPVVWWIGRRIEWVMSLLFGVATTEGQG